MKKIVFSKKDLKSSNVYKSKAMEEILENPKMAKILNHKEEKQLLKALREHGGSRHGVREALGELYYGNEDSLSKGEMRVIGKEIGGGALGRKKFIVPKKEQLAQEAALAKAGKKENATSENFQQKQAPGQAPIDHNAIALSKIKAARHADEPIAEEPEDKPKNIWTVLNQNNKED